MRCFVIEQGWVIVGEVAGAKGNTLIFLKNASVVRCWNNGRGIGGIAKAEYKDEYTLDPIGEVTIKARKILFEIPCEWE